MSGADRRRHEKEVARAIAGSSLRSFSGPIEERECRLDVIVGHPGQSPPYSGLAVRALIDTGCTASCVRPDVAARLALPTIGTVAVATASTGGGTVQCPLVAARLMIGGSGPGGFSRVEPIAVTPMRDEMLFGMDLLEGGLLLVDLPNRSWRWSLQSAASAPSSP